MAPRRGFSVSTSTVSAPAYNTASPIVITGVDAFGLTKTWDVLLTDPLGGESLQLDEDVAQVTSIAMPAENHRSRRHVQED